LVRQLAGEMELAGVWQEEHQFDPLAGIQAGNDDAALIREHFAARDRSEKNFFDEVTRTSIPGSPVSRRIRAGGINDSGEIELMKSLRPDVVLVFGCGLLRQELISTFEGSILNMHLGLSPYYRGSGTNFWPLVNREPEYVGVTIHYIDAGIDTGPIICHGRPAIVIDDGPHDIGNKAIVIGTALLIRAAMKHCQTGRLPGVLQEMTGKLFRMRDFNGSAVNRLYRNFETGMIEEYLRDKEKRDAPLSLVSLPDDGAHASS
jgi:phosphoribosylglycinamide formyltransferase 1